MLYWSYDALMCSLFVLQIANPSPSGGRINIQFWRVECAPPSNLVVIADNDDGGNAWIRLKIYVGAFDDP